MVLLLFIIAGLGIYIAIDNGGADVIHQRVLVGSLPEELEEFSVLLVSDLNGKRFGPRQKYLQPTLQGLKYNAVCITGNILDASGSAYPLYELLDALPVHKPIYYSPNYAEIPVFGMDIFSLDWVAGLQARGVTFLETPEYMTVGKSKVWFSDASQVFLDLETAKSAYEASSSAQSRYQQQLLTQTISLRKEMGENDLHIVLSPAPMHRNSVVNPQNVTDPDRSRFLNSIHLILSGGTAGGQWQLPLIGPVWSDVWFPKKEEVQGYHYVGNYLQYISSGLGVRSDTPLPHFRMFNTPEITLVTFTSRMDNDVLPFD